MELGEALTSTKLVWEAIGIALSGLAAAFVAGWTVRALYERRKIESMKGEIAKLAQEAAEKDRRNEALEEEIARLRLLTQSTNPGAKPPTSGLPTAPVPALPMPDLEGRWWLQPVAQAESQLLEAPRRGPKVMVVANLKGGVAKTMLSANLAAFFAKRGDYPNTRELKSLRVLLIDMDYQGSLSEMTQAAMKHPPGATNLHAKVQTLLSTDKFDDSQALLNRIQPGPGMSRVSLYPSEYGFDDYEFRIVSEWLAGETGDDVRFRLLRRLTSGPFAESFDLVIIDTGPRLTLGSIAALAAGTHLIVPSAPDRRSIEAADRFIGRVAKMREAGLTSIQCSGVIATLVSGWHVNNGSMTFMEERFKAAYGARGADWIVGGRIGDQRPIMLNNRLPFSVAMQRETASNIPYLASNQTRAMINPIGREIEERMG
jgi:cellulose biosynthesis protein BcsQ